jgi:hypothetical protein
MAMPPLLPVPPLRPNPGAGLVGNFHYHTYTYPGDGGAAFGPFVSSGGLPAAGGAQFYSLTQDMQGLFAWGAANGVPNMALNAVPGMAATPGGNQTLVLSFGAAPGANVPAVVFTGGIHAREWIAAEFTYLLAEYLCRNYVLAPASIYRWSLRRLVNSRRIYIAPMLNPDGNLWTVFTLPAGPQRLWRKSRRALPLAPGPVGVPGTWLAELTNNGALGAAPPPFAAVGLVGGNASYHVPQYDPANGIPPGGPAAFTARQLALGQFGVDLNRNLATAAWGYDAQVIDQFGVAHLLGWDPTQNMYFGPRAGSEPETANVQTLLAAAAGPAAISTSCDYHAHGKLILYPSETFNTGGIGTDYSILGRTLRQLVHTQGQLDYQLGSPAQLIQYDAVGSVIDRAAQVNQSRAFTIELDPAVNTAPRFRLPENQICPVFEKNIRGALALLAAPSQPANWFTAYLHGLPLGLNMLWYLMWDVYGRGTQLPA